MDGPPHARECAGPRSAFLRWAADVPRGNLTEPLRRALGKSWRRRGLGGQCREGVGTRRRASKSRARLPPHGVSPFATDPTLRRTGHARRTRCSCQSARPPSHSGPARRWEPPMGSLPRHLDHPTPALHVRQRLSLLTLTPCAQARTEAATAAACTAKPQLRRRAERGRGGAKA
jgi:hypothetical protein